MSEKKTPTTLRELEQWLQMCGWETVSLTVRREYAVMDVRSKHTGVRADVYYIREDARDNVWSGLWVRLYERVAVQAAREAGVVA